MTSGHRSILALGCLLLLSVAYCTTVSESPDPTPGNWLGSQAIGNLQESFRPHVAMDPDGNAIAVWDEDEERNSHEDIWSNRYVPNEGWTTPQCVGGDGTSASTWARVGMDANGNAVAVWHEKSDEDDAFSVWANRYDVAAGQWDTALLIENDVGNALFPQVAVHAGGDAVAVWHQSENIWSNYYSLDLGRWDDAPSLVSDSTSRAMFPQVTMDADGNAVAVWHQTNETSTFSVWSSRYPANTGWGTPQPISTNNEGDAQHPQVAMDADGNAIAVWHQSDGTRFDIWFNRYEAADGWGTAERIETNHPSEGNAKHPRVAMNAEGKAVAVWEWSYGPSVDVHTSQYTAAAGWSTSERIEANEGGSLKPKVVLDPAGNAVVVWTQADAGCLNDTVWANRYDAASGLWGAAGPIEACDEANAWLPEVAVDPNGNAVAVWVQGEAEFARIWSNQLEPPREIGNE